MTRRSAVGRVVVIDAAVAADARCDRREGEIRAADVGPGMPILLPCGDRPTVTRLG